ncbi:hypothetical protein ACL02R_17100 [Streptomyces sp. MS19]|uniref:hypothetical protein n=1 Tax=Streptomyces sp. MS19 TaxID=3385972 RepID=UPI00399F6634
MTRPAPSRTPAFLPETPLLLPLAALLVLAVIAVLCLLVRRVRRTAPGTPAVWVAALAAAGCTAYSADTSWRFAADYLDMDGTAERAAMFAAAELALFANALLARQNLAVQGHAGAAGTLVWAITGVQVIPAFAESGPVGGVVRAFVGPVMAALLWHQAMGIELRLRTPAAVSHGLLAVMAREARERFLARLGIERDRDAAQIRRDRATVRAAALAARLAERTPAQRGSRRGRRLARRLSAATARAGAGTDPGQRDALLQQLAARRHAAALATVALDSPWQLSGARCPSCTAGDRSPDTAPPSPRAPEDAAPGGGRRSPGPVPASHNRRPSSGRDRPGTRTPQSRTAPGRRSPLSVEEMADRVRPHVPAMLQRDGNEAVTRVQLREILRSLGLPGSRNERLTPVLELLRAETGASTTGSPQ